MKRYLIQLPNASLVHEYVVADSWKAKREGVYFYQRRECVAFYPQVASVKMDPDWSYTRASALQVFTDSTV